MNEQEAQSDGGSTAATLPKLCIKVVFINYFFINYAAAELCRGVQHASAHTALAGGAQGPAMAKMAAALCHAHSFPTFWSFSP